jgi:hypothetical protein
MWSFVTAEEMEEVNEEGEEEAPPQAENAPSATGNSF